MKKRSIKKNRRQRTANRARRVLVGDQTPKPLPTVPWYKSVSARVAGAFVVVATLLAYLPVIPVLTMTAGSMRAPDEPFEIHFILSNEWFLPIHHIRYDCALMAIQTDLGRIPDHGRRGVDEAMTLPAHHQMSMYCGANWYDGYHDTYPGKDMSKHIRSALEDVFVYYTVPMIPYVFHKSFTFGLVRNEDGSAEWLPGAEN